MRIRNVVLPVVVLVAIVGCQKKSAQTSGNSAAGESRTAAAPIAADMCAEHGVLEAICTKCHPKLIAVFKTNGDYCEEHGFPMSVCPVHFPERGGRPAGDVAIDEVPADGTKIRFKSLETARRSGLEFVNAVGGSDASGITAPAVVVVDASRMARVNAPARGVVRQLLTSPGSIVGVGSPLAIIASSEVGAARSNLQTASARARAAEAAYKREKELYERGVSALREVQMAEQEWETARGEVEAASATLSMMGALEGSAGTYVLRSPIRGTVTTSAASVGSLVDLEKTLFEIVDASTLWADIDVPEREAYRVTRGQRVVLRIDGLAGREFHGSVHSIAPVIDPHTRSAKARARITTKDRALRANMYARATVFTNSSQTTVLIPRAAVQEAKGIHLVFVRMAEDQFETRRVEAIPVDGEMVAISSGLKPGEPVVTTGSFLLKTETLKGSIGTGCCEVEPPKR
jgi:cobalt-zinc-cadmium efflux system membrane fusion protein